MPGTASDPLPVFYVRLATTVSRRKDGTAFISGRKGIGPFDSFPAAKQELLKRVYGGMGIKGCEGIGEAWGGWISEKPLGSVEDALYAVRWSPRFPPATPTTAASTRSARTRRSRARITAPLTAEQMTHSLEGHVRSLRRSPHASCNP